MQFLIGAVRYSLCLCVMHYALCIMYAWKALLSSNGTSVRNQLSPPIVTLKYFPSVPAIMYDAYVFDLDGTLIDIKDITWFRRIQRKVYGEFGVYLPPDDDLYTALKLPNDESLRYLRGLGIEDPERYWARLEEEDYRGRKELLDSGFLAAYPDVGALAELPGRIAMVSNTPGSVAMLELEHTGLLVHFEEIFTSRYNDERSKPNPCGILQVLEQLDVPPERAIMIGDSDLDVLAGMNAGTHTAHLVREHFDSYDKTSPTYFIHSLEELLTL